MYLSLYKAFNERTPTNYYPELEDEIWDGLISIDPYKPTGPEWEAFSQAVIERSQDPVWASYPYRPPNTSSLNVFAGKFCSKFSYHVEHYLALYKE